MASATAPQPPSPDQVDDAVVLLIDGMARTDNGEVGGVAIEGLRGLLTRISVNGERVRHWPTGRVALPMKDGTTVDMLVRSPVPGFPMVEIERERIWAMPRPPSWVMWTVYLPIAVFFASFNALGLAVTVILHVAFAWLMKRRVPVVAKLVLPMVVTAGAAVGTVYVSTLLA